MGRLIQYAHTWKLSKTFMIMAKMIPLITEVFFVTCIVLSVHGQSDSKWLEFLSRISSNTGGKDLQLKAEVDSLVPEEAGQDYDIDLDYVMNTEGSVPTPWMGSEYAMKGQEYMCRRGLNGIMKEVKPGYQCSMKTDLLALCQNAHVVEAMNALM